MTEAELELLEELGSFAYDPVSFVMWAFPWGEEGTELADEDGPNEWQLWVLCQVRDNLLTVEEALQIAITSGHGVGKSALVSWLVWWAFSTFPDTRGVVTANTENQLKTKTWVEISKWHRLFLARDLFRCTATALFSKDELREREWRIDIVPWSERNTEAFAGLHNKNKRLLIIFDEASAIPDIIWETTEGALTDKNTEILWFVAGNPTRTTGRFRECFDGGKFEHRWRHRKVDSRSVPQTNSKQIEKWIEDYGLDSDFVRVRVLGEFPLVDAVSFISRVVAEEAAKRTPTIQNEPVVLGVDVARFGDDRSVIFPRQGRDAKTHPPMFFQGISTTALVSHVTSAFDYFNASMIFVDGGGVGGGVVDQLLALGLPVHEVGFGNAPDGFSYRETGVRYHNKRSEIWGALREWLKTGAIPDVIPGTDISLVEELIGPSYSVNIKDKIVLESKDAMKRRGINSPDFADALACTFAYPVVHQDLIPGTFRGPERDETKYDPFSSERMPG